MLDAIHYLCIGKSYFQGIDSLNIRHEQNYLTVEGILRHGEKKDTIKCVFEAGRRKRLSRNKVDYDKISEHLGHYPVVMIAPDDLEMINDGSEYRRRFLDFTLSFVDAAYLNTLLDYNRILSQRNSFLKQIDDHRAYDKPLLQTFDEQLTPLGHVIHQARRDFVTDFLPLFQQLYQTVSNGKETGEIMYESTLEKESMTVLLQQSLRKDLALHRTNVGIHKDDLVCNLDNYPIKKFGSQGQKKTFLVSLKLAQYHFLKEKVNKKPILLLDDLFAKLDVNRAGELLNLVTGDQFGQVFISDTQKERLDGLLKNMDIPHQIIELNNKGTY